MSQKQLKKRLYFVRARKFTAHKWPDRCCGHLCGSDLVIVLSMIMKLDPYTSVYLRSGKAGGGTHFRNDDTA